jgi:hypothetical protein
MTWYWPRRHSAQRASVSPSARPPAALGLGLELERGCGSQCVPGSQAEQRREPDERWGGLTLPGVHAWQDAEADGLGLNCPLGQLPQSSPVLAQPEGPR